MSLRRLFHVTIAGLFSSIAHAATPDIVVYSGVPCGIAAAQAAHAGKTVHAVDVSALQAKLRSQRQVVDFIPGQPEKCEHLNGPPEF
jgi:hypothetical protein